MTPISRRTLLAGTAATGAASLLSATPASAGPSAVTADPVDGSTLPRFGPACLTAAVVAMAVHEGKAYLITRGIVPPSLIELDLATRRVTRTVQLPTGEGGWGITVAQGKVFCGLYPVADVYCFDPATGALDLVGRLGGYVWDMTTAPDGQVFAVSYPNGAVWQIDPATRAFSQLGAPVPGAQYARYVGAAENMVYAGIYTPAQLIGYDRTTEAFTDLTPDSVEGAAFGPFAAAAGRVFVGSARGLISMAPDGTDVRVVPLAEGERSLDALTVAPDGTAYLTTRGSGTVFRRGPDDTALTPVATPAPADEHRRLVLLDDTTLLGSTGSGALWWLDLETGTFELTDLVEAGFTPQPDRPQSIALGRPHLYVGGHWVITEHTSDGGSRRLRVGGEPKTMTPLRDGIYAALYPTRASCRSRSRTASPTSAATSSAVAASRRFGPRPRSAPSTCAGAGCSGPPSHRPANARSRASRSTAASCTAYSSAPAAPGSATTYGPASSAPTSSPATARSPSTRTTCTSKRTSAATSTAWAPASPRPPTWSPTSATAGTPCPNSPPTHRTAWALADRDLVKVPL